ncbi:hypothetical protein C1H76_5451 [Elsinoe australis]|uniref:Uncharacterized protein n=1 Tax=Elsinoe australis TaxID=40998 RepID=A0A4U7AV80_9PEZI|nr:hypothetical protein C1H76_5451 [Elsinoe australis]
MAKLFPCPWTQYSAASHKISHRKPHVSESLQNLTEKDMAPVTFFERQRAAFSNTSETLPSKLTTVGNEGSINPYASAYTNNNDDKILAKAQSPLTPTGGWTKFQSNATDAGIRVSTPVNTAEVNNLTPSQKSSVFNKASSPVIYTTPIRLEKPFSDAGSVKTAEWTQFNKAIENKKSTGITQTDNLKTTANSNSKIDKSDHSAVKDEAAPQIPSHSQGPSAWDNPSWSAEKGSGGTTAKINEDKHSTKLSTPGGVIGSFQQGIAPAHEGPVSPVPNDKSTPQKSMTIPGEPGSNAAIKLASLLEECKLSQASTYAAFDTLRAHNQVMAKFTEELIEMVSALSARVDQLENSKSNGITGNDASDHEPAQDGHPTPTKATTFSGRDPNPDEPVDDSADKFSTFSGKFDNDDGPAVHVNGTASSPSGDRADSPVNAKISPASPKVSAPAKSVSLGSKTSIPAGQETFPIHIRIGFDHRVTVEVYNSMKIMHLILEACKKAGVAPNKLELGFRGEVFSVGWTVEMCELMAGDTLDLEA